MAKLGCVVFAFVLLVTARPSAPHRILGVFPTPSRSHFALAFPLMKELADRGHEVTVISPYPQGAPLKNYKDVWVDGAAQAAQALKRTFYERERFNVFQKIRYVHDMGLLFTQITLTNSGVQGLLRSDAETFDLVLMEHFGNEALMGIAALFGAPLILMATHPSNPFNNYLFANPSVPSVSPHLLSPFAARMAFWERCQNVLYHLVDAAYKQWCILPRMRRLLHSHISPAYTLDKLLYNASLILLNAHPSFSEPAPLQPSMVEVGGLHVGAPGALPPHLRRIMDASAEGVVVFSMGSNLRSCDLAPATRQAMLNAFANINQTVLWKWEKRPADFGSKPSNVELAPWLPQADLLGHPNTRAFVFHGGLLSTIEAVHHGVPIIGIPVFGDQKLNVATAMAKGYAVSVPLQELDEASFSAALNSVLNDPKYRNNAKAYSKLLRDQQMKPLDRAVFWIEYVIRHRGAPFLRNAGCDLFWYQMYSLDVVSFLFFSVLCVAYVLTKIFVCLLYLCRRG